MQQSLKVINDMFQAVRGEQNCKDAIVFSFSV